MVSDSDEWDGLDPDRAYWEAMPPETPGEPSPADCLAQELLEALADIKLDGYGRRDDGDYSDGVLAGRLHATDCALRLVLKSLELSPRKRYIVENVLSKDAQT